MMDFKYALENFREGDKVQVSDGTDEPPRDAPSHTRWKARNFTGKLVGRTEVDGEPALIVETPKIDLGEGHSAVSQHFFTEQQAMSFWRETPLRGDVEALKRREINAVRENRLGEGLQSVVGTLDADPTSVSNLTAAAVRALIAQQREEEFREEWTTADNKVVVIKDADTMLQVAKEALDNLSKIHADARESKALLRKRDMTADKMLKLKFK
jgi:hypothetical protein